jgi:RNA polymerase sigma factor for flagellar operon FliA
MTAATVQVATSNNQQTGCIATRDELITEHLHLVTAIASHMQRSMSVHVELDDLVHAGMMGLFEAATKFDAEKEVSFAGYAKHRIRGAILDSLRQLDFASRDLRRRLKLVGSVTRDLSSKLHREPTEEEVATEMGLDARRWQALMVDFRNLGAAATQSRPEREDQRLPELPCATTEIPDQVFARNEMQRKLGSVLQGLPERHQRVVTMYYEGDMTMKQIGDLLGVNESRVSQIQSALTRMQVVLASRGVASASAFVN